MLQEFKKEHIHALAKLLEREADILIPWKCSPSTLCTHIAAIVRDFLRDQGERPSTVLIENGAVYVSRASKLSVEISYRSTCIYIIFPGPLDSGNGSPIEKAIQAHHLSVKGDLGEHGDWDTYFFAFSRQSTTEPKYDGRYAAFD